MQTKIWNFFLLSRPYTIPSIILIGFLANIIARQNFLIDLFTLTDIAFAISTWCAMVYLNESLKTQYGRIKISYYIPFIFFIIAAAISVYRNPLTLIFLAVALIGTAIYWLKSKKWFGSQLVFMFRGTTEIAIFLSILFFYSTPITTTIGLTTLAILFTTNSRNLIGDIRDIAFDKYTCPAKLGTRASKAIATILILAAIVITPEIQIAIPLIIMAIFISTLGDAYLTHQLFVLTTIFFLFNYCAYELGINLTLGTILYVGVLLGYTYKSVPRPANPEQN